MLTTFSKFLMLEDIEVGSELWMCQYMYCIDDVYQLVCVLLLVNPAVKLSIIFIPVIL